MNNNNKNIHNSGPLGMLVQNGQIKKVDYPEDELKKIQKNENKTSGTYFKTQSGIEFTEHDLLYVDPKECEPWKYANRQEDELGNIDELIESIKTSKQLQPALIRNHPSPHDGIKYEIIFGCRRHIACSKLGIPFLVIRKNISNIQDAIASQDAENKLRNDVSNYSNAILYKKLLLDGVFKTEKDLANKLRMSSSTLNDLMAYSKIPEEIVKKIPRIHVLSKQMATKIVQILNKSEKNYEKILNIADQIGKTISSQTKLEQLFSKEQTKEEKTSKTYISKTGKKLFVFKNDYRGLPSIVIKKDILGDINLDDMCKHVMNYIEEKINRSEYSD